MKKRGSREKGDESSKNKRGEERERRGELKESKRGGKPKLEGG